MAPPAEESSFPKTPLQGAAKSSAACSRDVLQNLAGPCGDRGCAVACRLRLCRTYALHYRAGVHARRGPCGGPEGYWQGQSAAPLSRLTPPAPLAGEPFRRQFPQKPPLQGEVDAPQGADGGVHCRFATEISCKARQGLAPASVGDDACIVPEALRRRRPPCGGRDCPPCIAAGNGR